MRLSFSISFLVGFLLATGISPTGQAQVQELDHRWRVTYVGKFQNPKSQKKMESLYFEFDANAGTYTGNLGCNSVQGTFSLKQGNGLVLHPGATTLMICPSMEVELDMQNALEKTRAYKIETGTLYLLNDSGKTLMMLQQVD